MIKCNANIQMDRLSLELSGDPNIVLMEYMGVTSAIFNTLSTVMPKEEAAKAMLQSSYNGIVRKVIQEENIHNKRYIIKRIKKENIPEKKKEESDITESENNTIE